MLHGMSVYYMARHHNGGRFVFYARPFLSACSVLLSAPLSFSFWQGALMVCAVPCSAGWRHVVAKIIVGSTPGS